MLFQRCAGLFDKRRRARIASPRPSKISVAGSGTSASTPLGVGVGCKTALRVKLLPPHSAEQTTPPVTNGESHRNKRGEVGAAAANGSAQFSEQTTPDP